jgi:hypothetical protein
VVVFGDEPEPAAMCHQPLTLIRPAATFSLREKKPDRPRLAKQGFPAGLLETFRFGHSLLDIHHSKSPSDFNIEYPTRNVQGRINRPPLPAGEGWGEGEYE